MSLGVVRRALRFAQVTGFASSIVAATVVIAVIAYEVYQTGRRPPSIPDTPAPPLMYRRSRSRSRVNDSQDRKKCDHARVERTGEEKERAAPRPVLRPTSSLEAESLSAPTQGKARQSLPPQTTRPGTRYSNTRCAITEEQPGNASTGCTAVIVPRVLLEEARAWRDTLSPANTLITPETMLPPARIPLHVPLASASDSSFFPEVRSVRTTSKPPTAQQGRSSPTHHADLEPTASLSTPAVTPVRPQSPATAPQESGGYTVRDGATPNQQAPSTRPRNVRDGTRMTGPEAGVHAGSSNGVGPARSTAERRSSTNGVLHSDQQSSGRALVAQSNPGGTGRRRADRYLEHASPFTLGSNIDSATTTASDLPDDSHLALSPVVDGMFGANASATRGHNDTNISSSCTPSPLVIPNNGSRPTPVARIPTVTPSEPDGSVLSSSPQDGSLPVHAAIVATPRTVSPRVDDLNDHDIVSSSPNPDRVEDLLFSLSLTPESLRTSLSPMTERGESELLSSSKIPSGEFPTAVTMDLSLPPTPAASRPQSAAQSDSPQDGSVEGRGRRARGTS